MADGRTDAEDGNGTVPGPGAGTAVLGGLAKGTPGGADGFCCIEWCCESGEGRLASKEGRSVSRDGGDLPRVGREVECVDGVRVRSNEGRGRILDGGVAFDDARSEDGGRGGWSLGAGEGGIGRPADSPNWIGKAARAGEIGAIRLALEGNLTRCKAGGMASRTGVATRSGGGVGAPGERSSEGGKLFGKGTLVAILDLSGGRR